MAHYLTLVDVGSGKELKTGLDTATLESITERARLTAIRGNLVAGCYLVRRFNSTTNAATDHALDPIIYNRCRDEITTTCQIPLQPKINVKRIAQKVIDSQTRTY